MTFEPKVIHASCVEIDGHGVLICGGSGSGKTSLLVEMVARGAKFVADDAVSIFVKGRRAWVTAPKTTKGLIGVSPLAVASVEESLPEAGLADGCLLELCVELDADMFRASRELLCEAPRVYLERSDLPSMAETCEKIVRKLSR